MTLKAKAKRIIRILHDYLRKHQCHFLAIFPDIDLPWKTPFTFWITNGTIAHYLYMWYLLNKYYLCLHFELEFYRYIVLRGNKYFHKFWFEILKIDAHNGEWIKYPTTEHPRFGSKITSTSLVVKLNSKDDVHTEGIFHPVEIHWVTNLDGTLHTHRDTSWASCYHALTMTESINKGILPEIALMDLEVCRQQWPHEDHWEMPNPLMGYDDSYYHNHDLDVNADVDEWFQGRDGWD